MTRIALYTDTHGKRPLRYPCSQAQPPQILVVRGITRYLRMVTTVTRSTPPHQETR